MARKAENQAVQGSQDCPLDHKLVYTVCNNNVMSVVQNWTNLIIPGRIIPIWQAFHQSQFQPDIIYVPPTVNQAGKGSALAVTVV